MTHVIQVYETPDNILNLFKEVSENEGSMSYRIIDYGEGMSMDNIDSMRHFIDCVGIHEDYIAQDFGTQLILKHPENSKRIVIDSSGLGDFFSHSFDCAWHEDDILEAI